MDCSSKETEVQVRRKWLGDTIRALASVELMMLATVSMSAEAEAPIRATPEIFAPGVISAAATDGAPTFSPDGRTLFFERTNSRWTAILESRRTKEGWTRPVLAPFSGETTDQQPALSPDGKYLVFVSARPLPSHDGRPTKFANHLYRVDRTPKGWTTARELPPEVNISNRVFKPSVAANGDLYFMSDIGSGGPPKWRLFQSRRNGETYEPAQALPFSGPDDGDVDPFIAPDQSYLIFSSNTRGAVKDGHEHLFLVLREGNGWSPVRSIRYAGDDWGSDDGEAQVSPDGRWLYFTSSRIVPMARVRDRLTVVKALRLMDIWDNSNSNVWRLPMSAILGIPPSAGGWRLPRQGGADRMTCQINCSTQQHATIGG
jgi:Tol biopolymer transport system component